MRSYVEFRAAPAHDGRAFECLAHNPTFGQPKNLSARITLVVLCECHLLHSRGSVISPPQRREEFSQPHQTWPDSMPTHFHLKGHTDRLTNGLEGLTLSSFGLKSDRNGGTD